MLTLLAAAEPSKVPFYIVGSLFAVWAVVLSAAGLTRATFPFSAVGERAVMAISIFLAVLTIAMAIVTSP